MIKLTLRDLGSFIKKPNDNQIQLSIKEKFYFIFILFTIKIIAVFFFILPILNQINKWLNTSDNNIIDIESYSALRTFFGYVLIGPLIEEIIFRNTEFDGTTLKVNLNDSCFIIPLKIMNLYF